MNPSLGGVIAISCGPLVLGMKTCGLVPSTRLARQIALFWSPRLDQYT